MKPLWGAAVLLACLTAAAQERRELGCEPSAEVKQALAEYELRDRPELDWSARQKLRREIMSRLLAQYPGNVHVHRTRIDRAVWHFPDEAGQIRETYRREASEHPEDALALYAAGHALFGYDTTEAIRLLERSLERAPSFPWPHLRLAQVRLAGRFADKEQARAHIASFFKACPASLDAEALALLSENSPHDLQAQVAKALRARLASSADPAELRAYSTVWAIEFRTRPVKEHSELRRQVAADAARLASLAGADAPLLEVAINGLKQANAPAERIPAVEDRILKEFPRTEQALNVLWARWNEANKAPDPSAPAEEWDRWTRASAAAIERRIAPLPHNYWLVNSYFRTLAQLPDAPPDKLLRAGENWIRAGDNYWPPSSERLEVAAELLRRGIATRRALEMVETGVPLDLKDWERRYQRDTLVGEQLEGRRRWRESMQLGWVGLRLQAYRLAGKPGLAEKLAAEVDGPEPKYPDNLSTYWWNRARLAHTRKRLVDAGAFYVRALQTRKDEPRPARGRIRDPLKEEAHDVWRAAKGSAETFALLLAPLPRKAKEETSSGWQRPTKELPRFELADLKGGTWPLKTLEGKALLINLWATWCGPCKAELPKIQKLYERVKDRKDLAVLTFNVDEEVGRVEPFVNEKGYTFPVLLAYSLVENLFDGYGIPQNWIIDAQGKWLWQNVGFDPASPTFEDDLLALLEGAKTAK